MIGSCVGVCSICVVQYFYALCNCIVWSFHRLLILVNLTLICLLFDFFTFFCGCVFYKYGYFHIQSYPSFACLVCIWISNLIQKSHDFLHSYVNLRAFYDLFSYFYILWAKLLINMSFCPVNLISKIYVHLSVQL